MTLCKEPPSLPVGWGVGEEKPQGGVMNTGGLRLLSPHQTSGAAQEDPPSLPARDGRYLDFGDPPRRIRVTLEGTDGMYFFPLRHPTREKMLGKANGQQGFFFPPVLFLFLILRRNLLYLPCILVYTRCGSRILSPPRVSSLARSHTRVSYLSH